MKKHQVKKLVSLKLIPAIESYYNDRGQYIDDTIKNDEQAIKLLTQLESAEIKDKEVINEFIKLCDLHLS